MDLAIALHDMWLNLLKAIWPERPAPCRDADSFALPLVTGNLLVAAIGPGGAPLSAPDLAAVADIDIAFDQLLKDFEAGKAQTPEERRIARALAHIKREYLR